MVFEAVVLLSLGKPVKVPDITGQPTIVDVDTVPHVWAGCTLYKLWWNRFDGEFYRWHNVELGIVFKDDEGKWVRR